MAAVFYVVVGGNRGIGLEVVRLLAEKFRSATTANTIIMTCRDAEQGRAACETLKQEIDLGEFLQVDCMELDVTKHESIERFTREFQARLPSDKPHAIRLIHNAGFAFSMTSSEAFAEQAKVTCDINYFGAVHLLRQLQPALQAAQASSDACRVVYVSSFAGESAHASLSEGLKERLAKIVTQGTGAELDQFVADFVAAAQEGMTLKDPYSPTSWLFFAASWVCGQSAHTGADTPVWLAVEAEPGEVGGRFVSKRAVQS